MNRRGLILGSLAVAGAALMPTIAYSNDWLETAICDRSLTIEFSKEWAYDMRAHWGIDIHAEASNFLFEFPDYVHTIVKDREWFDGSGLRRLHMHWTVTPTDKPNTYTLHSEGYVESFKYTDQGPVLITIPNIPL